MAIPPNGQHWPGLGEVVEAYEAALARGEAAEVVDFAPPPDHPERLAILCELVRVDLEHRWERGRPRRLEEYRALLPGALRGSGSRARDGLRGVSLEAPGRRGPHARRVPRGGSGSRSAAGRITRRTVPEFRAGRARPLTPLGPRTG